MDATDSINAGLWATLSGDAQLYAALGSQPAAKSKGVWNMAADDSAPLPLVTFRQVIANYDYVYAGLSAIRYVYKVMGFAEDAAARAGGETVALIVGHLMRVLTDAQFAVTGFDLELCRPMSGIPPESRDGDNGHKQYGQGILLEVVVTPT